MGADLLRRAADKLRKAVDGRTAGEWFPVITDSESSTGVGICQDHAPSGVDPGWVCDECHVVETYSEALADYIALMHPPVGLALADAMDAVARVVRYNEHSVARVGYGELIAAARAVLREDGESA
jgi:hypothetical protein